MDRPRWPLALCCARTGLMALVTVWLQPTRPGLLCYSPNQSSGISRPRHPPDPTGPPLSLHTKRSVPLVGPLPPRCLTGLLFGKSAQVGPCDSKRAVSMDSRARGHRLEVAVTCRHQESMLPSVVCRWPDVCPGLCHTSVGQIVKFTPQDTWMASACSACALWFTHSVSGRSKLHTLVSH